MCVDLLGPYVIRRNSKKEKLHLKAVTVNNTVTGWFKIAKYEDKRAISIANLIETLRLSRWPKPIEIMYNQGKELIDHEIRKSLIET